MPTNNCYELRHPAFIYEGSEDPLKAAVEDAIKDMRIDASWEISVIPVGAPTYSNIWPLDHLLVPYYTRPASGNTQIR
jgi:hypothetical protein